MVLTLMFLKRRALLQVAVLETSQAAGLRSRDLNDGARGRSQSSQVAATSMSDRHLARRPSIHRGASPYSSKDFQPALLLSIGVKLKQLDYLTLTHKPTGEEKKTKPLPTSRRHADGLVGPSKPCGLLHSSRGLPGSSQKENRGSNRRRRRFTARHRTSSVIPARPWLSSSSKHVVSTVLW